MMKKPGAARLLSAVLVGLAIYLYAATTTPKFRLGKEDAASSFHFYSNPEQDAHQIAPSAESRDAWQDLLTGFWEGAIDVGDDGLRILYRITENYGEVMNYSLDQGGGLIPGTAAQFNPDTKMLVVYFDTIGGVYRATLDSSGQLLAGTWKQSGRSFPFDLVRFQAPTDDDGTAVPHAFRFLIDKTVTGNPDKLQNMVGFWSGYLDDSFDQEDKEPPELVIVQIEQVAADLVEPKVFLPDETALPAGFRSFVVRDDGTIKVVLDDPLTENNAIFIGELMDSKTWNGVVQYDDAATMPPLHLTWSEQRPDPDEVKDQMD